MRARTESELVLEARQRAYRARCYAEKFPVSEKEKVFGTREWQLEALKRFGAWDPELGKKD